MVRKRGKKNASGEEKSGEESTSSETLPEQQRRQQTPAGQQQIPPGGPQQHQPQASDHGQGRGAPTARGRGGQGARGGAGRGGGRGSAASDFPQIGESVPTAREPQHPQATITQQSLPQQQQQGRGDQSVRGQGGQRGQRGGGRGSPPSDYPQIGQTAPMGRGAQQPQQTQMAAPGRGSMPQSPWGKPVQQQQPGGPQLQQGGPQPQPGGPQPQPGGPQQQQGGPQPQQGGPQPPPGGPQPRQGGPQPQQGQQQQRRGPPPQQQQRSTPPRQQTTELVSKMSSGGAGDGINISNKISKGGERGRRIGVYTNHFEMKMGKVKRAYHYDVDINPDKPKKVMKDVMQLFRKQYYPNRNPAFDGKKNLFSASLLPFGTEQEAKIVLEFEGRNKEYVVKIKKVAEIDMTEIDEFFNQVKHGQIMEAPMRSLQVLDILLRHSLSMKFICVGSSFFSEPKGRIIDLGNGMEMYHGNFQSVGLGWKPYLNVDVANKAFPSAVDIVTLIKTLFGDRIDLERGLQHFQLEELSKHMKTLRVQYEIPGNPASKRIYRVNEACSSAREIKFKTDPKGPEMTVEKYFTSDKNYRLRYPNLPCLWVGSKDNNIKVPAELCRIVPGQVVNRKLNANQTRNMIKECATSTDKRKASIAASIHNANYNADPTVREFDINISSEFEKIDARVLVPPVLTYQRPVTVRKGVWNAEIFSQPVKLTSWTVLNTDNRTKPNQLEDFAKFVLRKGRQLGLNMEEPQRPFTTINLSRNRELPDLSTFFKNKKGIELIFVVIPEFPDKIYNYVKQAAEIAVGCLTQCVKSKTLYSRLNDSTVSNILLKVNAKLNGLNHSLRDRPPIMNVPTMIMGADVTHPSPDSKDIPSVAAVTASHDPKAFKYNICWRLQQPGCEIIEDMQAIVHEQLMFFYRATKQKPQRIIFYRDGVSNGQFEIVLRSELQAIRAACFSLEQNYKPAITFLVVQKRHHTRLFPVDSRDSEDRNNNVPAGTCVDTKITHPTRQNFFLVSHASIQGVAKPTKYVTLWDDNNISDDDMESLTFYLCHLFARCTRSVSYPAPTYYAHLAAARAKVYCETKVLNMSKLNDEQDRMQIQHSIVKDLPMFFI